MSLISSSRNSTQWEEIWSRNFPGFSALKNKNASGYFGSKISFLK